MNISLNTNSTHYQTNTNPIQASLSNMSWNSNNILNNSITQMAHGFLAALGGVFSSLDKVLSNAISFPGAFAETTFVDCKQNPEACKNAREKLGNLNDFLARKEQELAQNSKK